MKRVTLMGLAVVVVLGMIAATAGAEGTGPRVTLRTAAGALKKGEPLVAFSPNLKFQASSGDLECTKNTLSATVKTNTKEKPAGTVEKAESTGEEGEGRCKSNGTLGLVFIEWQNLPWKLKLTNTGTVQITTGVGDKRLTFKETHNLDFICTFETKKLLSAFPVSATPVPLIITTTEQRFTLAPGSTAGCPTEGKMSGTFSTTSNGEAVEVEVK